jgi:hypothetical protein
MNADRLATLADLANQTAAILAGSLVVTLAEHDIANMQRELAEPFESCMTAKIHGRRTDADGIWTIALAKACRAKRAACLAAHFARFAAAA